VNAERGFKDECLGRLPFRLMAGIDLTVQFFFTTMRNGKDTSILYRVTIGEQCKRSTGKYAGYFLPLFKKYYYDKTQ